MRVVMSGLSRKADKKKVLATMRSEKISKIRGIGPLIISVFNKSILKVSHHNNETVTIKYYININSYQVHN